VDQGAIQHAGQILAQARRNFTRIAALPEACRPASVDDVHAIQDATVAALGERVAGWKVSPPIDGKLVRGAILGSVVFVSPAEVTAARMPMLGVECEIAFRFMRDLPQRSTDYSYDEVVQAVTAFPAIEIVDTRFTDYAGTPLLDRSADCVSNGGFVQGPLQPAWRGRDLGNIEVVLTIDGQEIVRRTGGHVAGDPLLPAIALVNELRKLGGVAAGQLMTTGTYTGLNYAKPGQHVTATFAGMGAAEIRFT
jgi:2-keto-4-pentenoate hydratase